MKKTNHMIAMIVLSCFIFNYSAFALVNQSAAKPIAAKLTNINTADLAGLDQLPKIGPKMALRILEYRKSKGNFKRIQDLMKVKGIGPKVFEKIQNLITV